MYAPYLITPGFEKLLLALQIFQVFVLWTHDWIPLGKLNDLAGVRAVYSPGKLVFNTLLQSVPWTFGLAWSLQHFGRPYPHGLEMWLCGSYIALFVGELRAWWLPYLLWRDEERIARYRIMFARTHSLLPERNGIRPNTLHMILHASTATTLLVLYAAGLFD